MGTPASLTLLKSVLPFVLCVHLAWTGLMAGGATAAVTLDFFATRDRHRALAAMLLDRVKPGTGALALLSLTGALILLAVQSGYPPLAPSLPFRAGTLAPLPAGVALLALYRRLLRQGHGLPLRPVIGLAGIALVLASSFLLCCGSGLLVMPEKWPLLRSQPLLFLSWSGTGRYLEFTCLSLAATGAVIGLLAERCAAPEDALFARRLGGSLALLFLLAWPPALLFTLFNLPAIALPGPVWLLAAAGLATAAAGTFLAAGMLGDPDGRRIRPLLAVSLALFPLWVATEHLARENALDEATLSGVAAVLPLPPEARKPVPRAAPEARKPVPRAAPEARKPVPRAAPAAGAAVFERVCAACHRFDARVVGPPLNSVVPKYRHDPEALKAFIRTPVKRDPAYPEMPKLPLTEAEIEAVSAYLLEKGAP